MPPTSDSELKIEAFAAYDGGLDVGHVGGGHNEGWFWGCGGSESEVPDVGVQDGRV